MSKHPMSVHVGRNIRLQRQQKGITIPELAKRLDTTHQQVQRYESGLNGTSASALYHIAVALGVDVRTFYDELEYNPEIERHHSVHWTTLRAAELLAAMPESDLRRDLQQVIRTLGSEILSPPSPDPSQPGPA